MNSTPVVHQNSTRAIKDAFLDASHPRRLGLEKSYLSKYTLKFLFFGKLAVPVVKALNPLASTLYV
jgi:hypothetical protein